jgi:hypothetical protein
VRCCALITYGQRRLNMKKLARLAGLLSLAIFAVGLIASSSASATGYLLLPVGQLILGLSLPGTLKGGSNTITCEHDEFTAQITSVHLIGPFQVHFLGCKATGSTDSGCPASSLGAASGLILTNTLHALIGLGLPGGLPALLVLPAVGKEFVKLEKSTNKEGTCTIATAVEGNVLGLLLQTVGKPTEKALLDFVPGDPRTIDLPLGGTVIPEIEAFGVEAAFETQVHLLYDPLNGVNNELMP